MPTLTIDGRAVTCPEGSTLLQAARLIGIDIPTLCHADGFEPGTSCMVCVVRVNGQDRLLPACSTPVAEGLVVVTNDNGIRHARRMAIELLLSDHVGDCEGPCRMACPAHFDIPSFLRALRDNQSQAATAIATSQLILPQTLGAVCPAPCQRVCRRGQLGDGEDSVRIRDSHRTLPPTPLDKNTYPPLAPLAERKRVAVIGAGPAGLAAAVTLRQRGHAVTLFEQAHSLAPTLRALAADEAVDADLSAWLPDEGITLRLGVPIRLTADGITPLAKEYDYCLIACGTHIPADEANAFATTANITLAGEAAQSCGRMAVRAIAHGKQTALHVDAALRGQPLPLLQPAIPFTVRMGVLHEEEKHFFRRVAEQQHRQSPTDSRSSAAEAARCLSCDCRAKDNCRLKSLAERLDARPRAFHNHRKPFAIDTSHGQILYEPGKCIVCGLCIQAGNQNPETTGRGFIGRGYDVQVRAPLHATLAEALTADPAACVRVCPTGALTLRSAANG